MQKNYTGSCLCGDIQFSYTGPVKDFSLCHCTMCQKFSGAAFGAFLSLEKDKFTYIKGKELVQTYSSSEWASRVFCKQCGSSLMYLYGKMPNTLSVSAGLFDTPLPVKPVKHIFVQDKCTWFDITDTLPQIQKY